MFVFGFCWQGAVVFVLPMLINIVYFIKNKNQSVKTNHSKALDMAEHILQALFVGIMLFVVSTKPIALNSLYLPVAAVFLSLYYIMWVFYFYKKRGMLVMLSLAILPVIYFVSAQLWLHNFIAVAVTVAFGIVHTIITYKDCKA